VFSLRYFHFRNNPQLIKTARYEPTTESQREKYFHMLLFLFKPWRNENELLQEHSSYENSFKFYLQSNQIDVLLSSQFESQRKIIKDAKDFCERILNEEFTEENDEEFNDINDETFNDNNQVNSLIMDINNNCLSSFDNQSLNENIDKLNPAQKKVFDEVIETINHQELHKNIQCLCTTKPEILRLFTSGVGGITFSLLNFYRNFLFLVLFILSNQFL
jgi:hypothetical protein